MYGPAGALRTPHVDNAYDGYGSQIFSSEWITARTNESSIYPWLLSHFLTNLTMQSGTGIQELMAAETRASQIVAEARIGECDEDGCFGDRHCQIQLSVLSFVTSFQRTVCPSSSFPTSCSFILRGLAKIRPCLRLTPMLRMIFQAAVTA